MKRYRLKKDLPTFKAGETFTLWDSIETQGLCRDSDDIMAYHQKTLDKFPNILTDWFEEIKPAEPLIKDEKVRKSVRAWAEVNGDTRFYYNRPTIEICINDKAGYVIRSIKFKPEFREAIDIKSGYYTVTELCGEEEE